MRVIIRTVAVVLGGGSLLFFGTFLLWGALNLVSFGWSNPWALAWDGLLSLLFFAQHSIMVRSRFRAALARSLPVQYHGALYAVASGLVLTIVVVFWQSTTTHLLVINGFPRWLMHALFALAAAGMAWGAVALKSFDPLGIHAMENPAQGAIEPRPILVIRGPYRWVRHPLYFFTIVMMWAFPEISMDRLLFDVLWTLWIYRATFWEEADLVALFGEPYRDYQRHVPRLLPFKAS